MNLCIFIIILDINIKRSSYNEGVKVEKNERNF